LAHVPSLLSAGSRGFARRAWWAQVDREVSCGSLERRFGCLDPEGRCAVLVIRGAANGPSERLHVPEVLVLARLACAERGEQFFAPHIIRRMPIDAL
jgi:hypothetical protein